MCTSLRSAGAYTAAVGDRLLMSDEVSRRHQAAEAQYNASVEASLNLLEEQPNMWGQKDLWVVLNSFYQCPGCHRIGAVSDGGAFRYYAFRSCMFMPFAAAHEMA